MKRYTYEDILAFNSAVCQEYSQITNVVSSNNILSALSVYDSYYDNDEMVISALVRSLIKNHGFSDGNKRTALLVMLDNNPKSDPRNLSDLCIKISINNLLVEDICKVIYKDNN